MQIINLIKKVRPVQLTMTAIAFLFGVLAHKLSSHTFSPYTMFTFGFMVGIIFLAYCLVWARIYADELYG